MLWFLSGRSLAQPNYTHIHMLTIPDSSIPSSFTAVPGCLSTCLLIKQRARERDCKNLSRSLSFWPSCFLLLLVVLSSIAHRNESNYSGSDRDAIYPSILRAGLLQRQPVILEGEKCRKEASVMIMLAVRVSNESRADGLKGQRSASIHLLILK